MINLSAGAADIKVGEKIVRILKAFDLVGLSQGKIRADKAHEKLVVMGFRGPYRSTRRAVAAAKARYQARRSANRP